MCRKLLLEVPGGSPPDVRIVDRGHYSGRSVVVACGRCKHLVEATAP